MKIVEQVIDLIKSGNLKEGDKLPTENYLTKKFGISRPSVREALSALEIIGVIESRGGKGNYIKNNLGFFMSRQKLKELEEEESPFQLLETKKIIETGAAGLSALKAKKEDIAAIQKSLDKIKKSEGNINKMIQYDREFHSNIAKSTHNSLLFSIISYLYSLSEEKFWKDAKKKRWNIPGRSEAYFKDHWELFNAIKNKNYQDARKKMYNHLNKVEKDLINVFLDKE